MNHTNNIFSKFSKRPVHADFEKLLNFIHSYLTTQDILETVNCFQKLSQIKILFFYFLFVIPNNTIISQEV